MKRYRIHMTVTSLPMYYIEAESKEEAAELAVAKGLASTNAAVEAEVNMIDGKDWEGRPKRCYR